MRVIIAGPRWVTEMLPVYDAIFSSKFQITTHLCGCSTGVDALAEKWAKEAGVLSEHYPANWKIFGKGAGPVRNNEMAQKADAAIILLPKDPHPMKGSFDMLKWAVTHKLKLYVHSFDGQPPEEPLIEPTRDDEMDLWP